MLDNRLPINIRFLLGSLINVSLLITHLNGQIFPVNNIVNNGDDSKHINIVYLSEGYTVNEMNKFNTDVLSASNGLINKEPYKSYQSYFNIYSVEVPSQESGADHPGTASDCGSNAGNVLSANTYFESTYDYAGIHRLLYVTKYNEVYNVLQSNVPNWDIIFIIVNHTMYGGGGGSFAVFSTDPSSSEIAIHELGHSFANLGDEYWSVSGERANRTQNNDQNTIIWKTWLYDFGIGIYEHESPGNGWYRPHQNCLMRYLNRQFCAVCSEHTIKTIYNSLNTIESYQPTELQITISQMDNYQFSIINKQPIDNTVNAIWYLDGAPIVNNSDTYILDPSTIDNGPHVIEVVSTDGTNRVRNDPDNLLSSTVQWDLQVELSTENENKSDVIPSSFKLDQNFPNPFNPTTLIQFNIPKATEVRITIYDIVGKEVQTLINGKVEPGYHSIIWDGTDYSGSVVSGGIYIYAIQSEQFNDNQKMVLLK